MFLDTEEEKDEPRVGGKEGTGCLRKTTAPSGKPLVVENGEMIDVERSTPGALV